MFNKISAWISALGQSMQFVAWWAHVGAANLVVSHCGSHMLLAAIIVTIAGAIKEFVFDAKYETNPPQTMLDNIEDFSGWVVGAWLPVVWGLVN